MIDRTTYWGNPYHIGPDGTRPEVIAKYRAYILKDPRRLASLSELEGKVLGCWCKPKPCHGDVLVELIEQAAERLTANAGSIQALSKAQ
jgi:hypothetical protein